MSQTITILKPNKPKKVFTATQNMPLDKLKKAVELTIQIHNRDNPADQWTIEEVPKSNG